MKVVDQSSSQMGSLSSNDITRVEIIIYLNEKHHGCEKRELNSVLKHVFGQNNLFDDRCVISLKFKWSPFPTNDVG